MTFRVAGAELYELDVPFRARFTHAAAERSRSGSLFLRIITDGGNIGLGETLPRPYVTGEERSGSFDVLAERVLPRLLDVTFRSVEEVRAWLVGCDGQAPADWAGDAPTRAAWCAVDLALLDGFTRDAGRSVSTLIGAGVWPEGLRYGAALSSNPTFSALVTLLRARAFGIRNMKVKLDDDEASDAGVRLARRVLGRNARVRTDSNMAWSRGVAQRRMARLARWRVEEFEQPLPADDVAGLAELVALGHPVMVDESVHDAASLERVIDEHACSSVNVRIAKCGGLTASLARARRAVDAGLTLQVGCQVGETSLLSAAQMVLVKAVGGAVRYVEGCYGQRLLDVDPVRPCLQFGRGGRAPETPVGNGFGVDVDLDAIRRFSVRSVAIGQIHVL